MARIEPNIGLNQIFENQDVNVQDDLKPTIMACNDDFRTQVNEYNDIKKLWECAQTLPLSEAMKKSINEQFYNVTQSLDLLQTYLDQLNTEPPPANIQEILHQAQALKNEIQQSLQGLSNTVNTALTNTINSELEQPWNNIADQALLGKDFIAAIDQKIASLYAAIQNKSGNTLQHIYTELHAFIQGDDHTLSIAQRIAGLQFLNDHPGTIDPSVRQTIQTRLQSIDTQQTLTPTEWAQFVNVYANTQSLEDQLKIAINRTEQTLQTNKMISTQGKASLIDAELEAQSAKRLAQNAELDESSKLRYTQAWGFDPQDPIQKNFVQSIKESHLKYMHHDRI